MKLELLIAQKLVVTTFNNGERLEWSGKCYSRARSKNPIVHFEDPDAGEVSPELFHSINGYFEILSAETVSKIESIYRDIYWIIEDTDDVIQLDRQLILSIYDLLSLIDWTHFHHWCITQARINLAIGIKESLSDKDSPDRTYFTADYENLVAFSILLKLLMPIWGAYEKATTNILNPDFVLIHGLGLIRNHLIEENPAFIKLEACVNMYARKDTKNSGYSITSDIGTEELPEYLMAMVLWKKVIIFDPRAYGKSVICDVHNLLEDKCKRIGLGGPKQKKAYNEAGEEMAITEMYKIYQRVPPSIVVMAEHYIETYSYRIVDKNSPGINLVIREAIENIDPHLTILNFHSPILAIVAGNHIGKRTIPLLPYRSLIHLIAAVAVYLAQNGFPTISKLITTQCASKDVAVLSFSGSAAQQPISLERMQRLNSLYSILNITPNPGVTLIDKIVKETNSYVWRNSSGKIALENLANELAELLITFN